VRQLLTESLLLALLGGVAGVALAFSGSRLLVGLLSTRLVPLHLDLRPDFRVFVFAAMVALLTALFFGMAPALRASRYRATGVLRESGRGLHSGTRRWGLGKMLVALQMALSLLLLVGAGLFVRSLAKLASLDVGFRQDGLLLVVVDCERIGQKGAVLADFYQQAVERVASLPGVYSTTLSSRTPTGGDFWNSMISVKDFPQQAESMYVYFYRIGLGFFRTFGTPLLVGRDFGPQDNEGSRKVAIINESVAKSYFPSLNPLGRLISAPQDPERRDMEVIGVVKDAKYSSLREPRSHTIYLPYRQHLKRLRGVTISVRADPVVKEVGDLAKAIRREISSLNPEVAMTFRTMTEQVNQQLLEERLIATLSAFFGLLALLLASVGLYGVMAYTVERRTWEVGIRMALGARRSDVVWLVFRETLVLVSLGAFIGVLAAYGASRWIGSMLFGVTPADPLAFAGATVLLFASALLGSYIPALRAARVDPMVALRYE
jgi:predicted permease